jgi:hypothetical protein
MKKFLPIAIALTLMAGRPLNTTDAFNALAPGADFSCLTQTYEDCVWNSAGIPQPTKQQVTDWIAAHANDDANEAQRIDTFKGVVANCNAASLALTADCVAFVEDKLKTMNASQFATWYTTNVNTQAKAQTVLGLVTMVLAHQVRLN